ncbi:hypothetical protein AB0F18_34255 [Streptomyces sp. NPDC029216]|uniref:hypothetical protein n=1 Tax=Streptomyces sp. NPDC029216 TaxID=3154701 RepID=UPI0033E0FC47
MRALEDVKNQVRSLTSRRYVEEAIAAYGASAYRSALIATWIAVAADIIEKIRIMADEGESEAICLRDDLDKAIAHNNIAALQDFERKLVSRAHTRLQLIEKREHDELERIYLDRHLCAHPAFVAAGEELFNPTAELVRAHLAVAVDALLSHPPVTGRRALERFGREVASDSWPRDDERLAEHLRASYMDHGTRALRANLIKVVCKDTLKTELTLNDRWRRTRTARELQKIAPAEFEEQLRSVLDRHQNQLNEHGLMALISGLCYVPGTWDLLHGGTQGRIETLMEQIPARELLSVHLLFHGPLPQAPIDQMLLKRLERVTELSSRRLPSPLAYYFGDEPDSRLIPELIRLAADAGSFPQGGNVLRLVNALAPFLTEEHLEQLLEACGGNPQIAGGHLGGRELLRLRYYGPQTDRALAAWARFDTVEPSP